MNLAGWPPEVLDVFERSITVEFATLTGTGRPIAAPTTPYLGRTGDTIDVSTGLTYPAKAERARRNPRVALLFADPIGPGMAEAPVVLVQGLATVRDADLQANTDRYVSSSMDKLPDTAKGKPRWALRHLAWYYARIWIEVTPLHIRWWPGRDLSVPMSQWNAVEGTAAPLSDPPPPGGAPKPWMAPATNWRRLAGDALARLPLADLTVVDAGGFPLCLPLSNAELAGDGIAVHLGPGAPEVVDGPACITIHGHDEHFSGQENHTLVGTLVCRTHGMSLHVERALGDWSLTGGTLRMSAGFLSKGPVLWRRLREEAGRRGQPVPRVHLPDKKPPAQPRRPGTISTSS